MIGEGLAGIAFVLAAIEQQGVRAIQVLKLAGDTWHLGCRAGPATVLLVMHHQHRRLDALKRRVENSAERLRGQIVGKMEKMHLRLRALAGRLDAVSPLQVLGRGYSLTKVLSDYGTGKLVFDASEVASGQRLETTVAKGTIVSVVV